MKRLKQTRAAGVAGRGLRGVATSAAAARTAVVNELVVRAYYRSGFNKRRLDVVATTHDPAWTGHFTFDHQAALHGRSRNVERLQSILAAVPDARIEVRQVRARGNFVAAHVVLSGTRTARDGSVKPFASHSLALHRLVRGRIVDEYVAKLPQPTVAMDTERRISRRTALRGRQAA